jgi:nucleotide-binding universal stress UspA family protein
MEEGLSHDLIVPDDRADEYVREVNKELADFEYDNLEDCEGLSVRAEAFEAVNVEWGITDYLGMVKADLVVIGTRGRSPLKTLIMGSIAEHVVCESKCAVLTVKPEGFAYRV